MNPDYIIVGAGLAGLHTGIGLLKKHPRASVIILEKYGYTGGRVVTYRHTIPGFGKVQWENGAGRIHKELHPLIMKYIKRYSLEVAPIGRDIQFYDSGALRQNLFETTYLPMIQQVLLNVEPLLLRTHTIKELLEQILGSNKTDQLLGEFAYDSEIDTLRADWALHVFNEEMGSHEGYVVCTNGLDKIIEGMVREFKAAGGKILEKHPVKHIHKETLEVDIDNRKQGKQLRLKANKAIILALHHEAICELGDLRGCDMLRQVKMRPLLRTYAVFKDGDLKDLPRFVARDGIRYFIPMNGDGTIAMISYTDGKHAEKYMKILKEKGDDGLCKVIMNEMRLLFPNRKFADPVFFKAHPWYSGCSYWLPGDYDVTEASLAAHTPFGEGVRIYICGESFSTRQAWMEGALEHAESLLDIIE